MGLLDKVKGNKKLKDMIFSYDKSDKNHTEFISTGCLSLNVLFSGKLDGGIPKGKISTIAAPSASGKSFVGMKVVKNAQKAGMDVIYLDTEFAFSYSMANNLGIDESKLLVIQDNQIEDVQKNIMTIFDDIEIEERKNVILVIDSWGGFVTSKTITDATSGKDVTDMTISKKKNSLARILTGLRTTVFVVAQTYETMDMYNPLAIGGGKGVYFASSSIVMGSTKAKQKDSAGEILGMIINTKVEKGRYAKEHSKLKFLIEYSGGINPFFGLLDDAVEGGYIEKPSMGFYSRPCVEGDKKIREKQIYNKEFWGPILKETDFKEFIAKKYTFEESDIIDEDFEF